MEWGLLLFVIAVLLVLMFSGMWTAVALGTTGLVTVFFLVSPKGLIAVAGIAFNNTNSFLLTAVPVFLFMGEVLFRSGTADRVYRGISRWLTWLPGGLLHVNIGACAIFAATSGSSAACAATVGTVAIPEMKKRKYNIEMTVGSLAAGGTLGILIPPSIPMIIYGGMVDASVGRLFMAGMIPGIIMSAMFSLYILVHCLLRPGMAPREPGVTWKDRLKSLPELGPVILLIFVVLGTIYLGVATPTEAAALGVLFTLALAFGYRTFSIGMIRDSLTSALKTTVLLMFLIIGANILAYGMAGTGQIARLTRLVGSMSFSPYVVLIFIFVLYIILGMLMDGISMMIITLPAVYPIITQLGFDPVWFGVILVLLIETGLLTPPVGLNLFIIQGMSGEGFGGS